MTWAKELEELRAREALAEQMGGADKVARQHGRGKMDARARLAALVDEGSFREIGKIAGSAKYDANGDLAHVTPAPFLFGKALINHRGRLHHPRRRGGCRDRAQDGAGRAHGA
jgi:acetyl-CoA carboxylase carboxyltransferase component